MVNLQEKDGDLIYADLTYEEWREYDIVGRAEPYKIYYPKTLYYREGGDTHRVLDQSGIVHTVPIIGTVHRAKPKDSNNPVNF